MAEYAIRIQGKLYRFNTVTLELHEIKEEAVVNYPEKEKLIVEALDIIRKLNLPI